MKIYAYFERDYFNNDGSLPMTQNHYYALLCKALQYCSMFSMNIHNIETEYYSLLEKWKAPELALPGKEMPCNCYNLCQNSFEVLREWIFPKINNENYLDQDGPADLSFYRSDGSLFLEVISHEGEYWMYPQPKEDVNDVLLFGNWLPMNKKGYPQMPAKLVNIRIPVSSTIENDLFYIQLIEIYENAIKKLHKKSIHNLKKWISNYRPAYFGKTVQLSPNVTVLPKWYIAFEYYILAQYDALTTDTIWEVLQKKEQSHKAFDRFFEHLDSFVKKNKSL